jgi:hypothetical protein
MTGATPGDIFAALFTAHQIGDYWVQTSRQAAGKGLPGWQGRLACARHAATMTACKAASLAVLHACGHRVSPGRAAAALAADGLSHYWADRRTTLEGLAKLADRVNPGKHAYYKDGGAPLLDQAFHTGCLWAAAVIAARQVTPQTPGRATPRSARGSPGWSGSTKPGRTRLAPWLASPDFASRETAQTVS